MGLARLTVVENELAAEIVCGRLRASGIDSTYRKTDVGVGAADGGLSAGGPTEVLVDEHDLADARQLLAPE